MKVQVIKRCFKYNGATLEDMGLEYTPEQMKENYTLAYPELVNSVIEGPVQSDGKLVYEFKKSVGSKG